MESLIQDLRYGARAFFKNPGFTLIAVLTLALGIGANTAIFSLIDAVLLEPLPFPDSERLVTVWNVNVKEQSDTIEMTWPDFADYRAAQESFEHLAAFTSRDVTLTGEGDALRLRGAVASSELFPLLGVAPAIGRHFTADEERPGAHSVILSHGLFERRFNADPQIVGRALTLNGMSFTVVGVMPPGFRFPLDGDAPELWLSAGIDGGGRGALHNQRGNHYLEVIGRLKEGVTLAAAQAEMERLAQQLAAQYPGTNTDFGARVVPYFDRLVGNLGKSLLLLFGAVGCVLLIACANVANLLLARAATRGREMAIRAALGASRLRVMRQLLVESVLLACAGGLAGVLLAWWGSDLIWGFIPEGLPRASEAAIDGRVLGFTLLLAILTGVIFGLAPAIYSSKTDLTSALKEGGRGAGDGSGGNRLRGLLVIAEVAVSFVLLLAAGLLLGSFIRLGRIDPGFDPERMLTFRVSLPAARYAGPAQVEGFYRQLVSRIENLPGVRSASGVSVLPLSGLNSAVGFAISGVPTEPERPFPHETYLRISRPGYFRTMGIGMVKGRDFDERDEMQSTPVVIINETLARRHFPNEDPIGKRINPSFAVDDRGILWREIIGVVKDVRHASLGEEAGAESYVPHTQVPWNTITLVARTTVEPQTIIGAVRNEVRSIDRDLPIYSVRTLEENLSRAVAQPRFNMLLVGLFAAVALLLTMVGLYGVISYGVTERRREIGIRLALGASRRDLLSLVVGQGMKLAGAGLVIGCAAGYGAARMLESMLYATRAHDPLIFIAIALLLAVVALFACYLPARRATRVDPMIALRSE